MSICDDVQRVITEREEKMFDVKTCEMYEEASRSFQELVDRGIAYKRGYQLLPIESTTCNNVEFNAGNVGRA